jgi:hypothetical protein
MAINITITFPVHPLATEDNIWNFVDAQKVLTIEDIEICSDDNFNTAYFSITPYDNAQVTDKTEEQLIAAVNAFYGSLDDPFNDDVFVTYDSDVSTLINYILNQTRAPVPVQFAIDRLLYAKREGLTGYSVHTKKGYT